MDADDLRCLRLEYMIAFGLGGQDAIHLGNVSALEHDGIISSQFYGPAACTSLMGLLGDPPVSQVITQGSVACFLFVVSSGWLVGAFGHRENDIVSLLGEVESIAKEFEKLQIP